MTPWRMETETIPLDIYEEGDNLIIEASVRDIKPEELNVRVHGNLLTISGETKHEAEREGANCRLRESRYD